MEAPVSQSPESETESTDGEESEQQTEAQAESSDEDQPNTQGGASSSGADLEDVRDDWYDEDGNLMDDEGGSEGGDTSETQRAFDNACFNLSSRHYGRDTIYVEISDKVDIDNHVVDCKLLHSWIDSQTSQP